MSVLNSSSYLYWKLDIPNLLISGPKKKMARPFFCSASQFSLISWLLMGNKFRPTSPGAADGTRPTESLSTK